MLLMRSALAAPAPGAPGWAAMPACGASLIQATASGPTPRAAACVCRIPAARRSGLSALAVGKPTAAIAVASGPARKKTMTDLAGNHRHRTLGSTLSPHGRRRADESRRDLWIGRIRYRLAPFGQSADNDAADEHRDDRCNHGAVAARRDFEVAQLLVQKLLVLHIHGKSLGRCNTDINAPNGQAFPASFVYGAVGFFLSAPPRRQAIGHASVADAV